MHLDLPAQRVDGAGVFGLERASALRLVTAVWTDRLHISMPLLEPKDLAVAKAA